VARKGKKTETENDSTEMEHFPIVIRNTFTHRRNQTPWRKVETEKNGGRNETIEAQPYSTQEDSEREREIDKKKRKEKRVDSSTTGVSMASNDLQQIAAKPHCQVINWTKADC